MVYERSILRLSDIIQGLGMHTVHQLASTPGVLVFMGSRKTEAAEEALTKFASEVHTSSTVIPVQLDITDDISIKAAYVFVVECLKNNGLENLNVLVNNAAIGVHTFKESYEVNVFGTVAVTEAFRPLLGHGGTILNVSSGLGSISAYTKRPAPLVFPAYATSKSALNALTVQWALQEEQKGSGIRVISVDPGHTRTNFNKFTGGVPPENACKVIVKAALEKEGRTAVFINKDGDVAW
ncbi:hypothetical protein K438DRAFT_1996254 [Mycena galopus ATCC 62051]|nr:hypothetical protein K438DRAFT_1996254 [Mycena galopus ATCC 62051]